jgi:hypothetical protein
VLRRAENFPVDNLKWMDGGRTRQTERNVIALWPGFSWLSLAPQQGEVCGYKGRDPESITTIGGTQLGIAPVAHLRVDLQHEALRDLGRDYQHERRVARRPRHHFEILFFLCTHPAEGVEQVKALPHRPRTCPDFELATISKRDCPA